MPESEGEEVAWRWTADAGRRLLCRVNKKGNQEALLYAAGREVVVVEGGKGMRSGSLSARWRFILAVI